MKSDIDCYMEEAGLEALLVIGAAAGNPPMVYFTGLAHLGHAELVKKRGEPPILFCQPMERDEAVRTGLRTRDISDYDPYRLLKEADGDQNRAMATRYTQMLRGVQRARQGGFVRQGQRRRRLCHLSPGAAEPVRDRIHWRERPPIGAHPCTGHQGCRRSGTHPQDGPEGCRRCRGWPGVPHLSPCQGGRAGQPGG